MKQIEKIEKFGDYLIKKGINKTKIIVMSQKKYQRLLGKITAENTYDYLKKYLLNKYQIKVIWEYGNNYITFIKD